MKIVIFGNSGSGKTTLAQKLATLNSINYLDLDTIAWKSNKPKVRRELSDSILDLNQFTSENESWIVEGCYSGLLKIAMEHSTEIIFLNPGVEACVANCKKRPWEQHKYKTKEEQNKNLDMLIGWVRDYEVRRDEFSLSSHRALFEHFLGDKQERRDCQG